MTFSRKPMARRAGFKRPEYVRAAPAAPARATRPGVMARCADMGIPMSKTEAHRNPHLLAMARGKPCLFRLPGICNFDPETTVACHSNLGMHGKGGARKADDEYSAWGCFACHSFLDQGGSDAVFNELSFMSAHLAQVCEWRAIAGSTQSDPKDRAAAQWALDHLNATPVVQELTP